MATLAKVFGRPGAEMSLEAARRSLCTTSARGAVDPFRLRALPLQDVIFYSKKIDNSRLVRETDTKGRGACWQAIGAAALLVAMLTGALVPAARAKLAGYRLEALRSEERRLLDERKSLELEEAALLNPARLERLAKGQNLVTPSPGQVVHLEHKPDGAVAMVK